LEAVRSVLEAGETDLARLAARCGFSSHAHMTRAFGAAFGLTPSAYRARFQQVHRGEASSHSGGASGRSALG
jgi:transcriptional regulator GlxA family with amidase domain